ncbi:MAG TPA: HDOD domain-containing protein [Syntrophorhabdales bacterium]|nr:HDOD domain-containing protein [Syntrophorhabdales bacterium]
MDIDLIPIENERDRELLRDIQDYGLKKIRVGFSSEILDILDDSEAKSSKIETLKDKLDKEIVLRLFAVANSVRYGKLSAGSVHTFFEVVMRLGMTHTKVLIAALSIATLSHDSAYEAASARSFATSLLGRLLAQRMRIPEDDVRKVELGGLFLEVGKLVIRLYHAAHPGIRAPGEFINRYHPYIGIALVEHMEFLPKFLVDIISPHAFTFEEDILSVAAVVDLAHNVVYESFKKHGKLVIASPLPDEDGYLTSTIGSVLEDQFAALGLGQYVEIIPVPSRRERLRTWRPSDL